MAGKQILMKYTSSGTKRYSREPEQHMLKTALFSEFPYHFHASVSQLKICFTGLKPAVGEQEGVLAHS